MSPFTIRPAAPEDQPAAYYVALKTGDFGQDGEPFYREDPDALGRIFVGPYLAYEPDFSLVLEDDKGVCGFALGALDSRSFYQKYETEWRPKLCARYPDPQGDPSGWTRVQQVHHCYHQPDYFFDVNFIPEPYQSWPSHLHIDLLPRAQGQGYGRIMTEQLLSRFRRRGSPGAHLVLSQANQRAFGFYQRLGFRELCRVGPADARVIYMAKAFPT